MYACLFAIFCSFVLMQVKWIGRQFASNFALSLELFSVSSTSAMPSARICCGPTCCVRCAGWELRCTMPSRARCIDGCKRTWLTGYGQLDTQVLSWRH